MEQKTFARSLRRNQTDAESVLWYNLRSRRFKGYKFRRQHPLAGYVVDFVCIDRRFIIEIDGGQHAAQEPYDRTRTGKLQSAGLRVLRFWNNEVLGQTQAVLEAILRELEAPSPCPLPPEGGEGKRKRC
jgi:adenine-specific DNA-methyltransferase